MFSSLLHPCLRLQAGFPSKASCKRSLQSIFPNSRAKPSCWVCIFWKPCLSVQPVPALLASAWHRCIHDTSNETIGVKNEISQFNELFW